MAKLLAERKNKKNEIYICEAVCEAVRKKNTGTKVAGPSRDSRLTFK